MYIENITLIEIEWNRWNGFFFHLLKVNDHSLFGIGIGTNFVKPINFIYIDILFFNITIERKRRDKD